MMEPPAPSLGQGMACAAQSARNRNRGRMRIASLVFTPLSGDARVRRTAEALSEAGHEVLVVARPPFPTEGAYRRHELPRQPPPMVQRLALVATQAPATLLPGLAP